MAMHLFDLITKINVYADLNVQVLHQDINSFLFIGDH
jgi:hypothetical protein